MNRDGLGNSYLDGMTTERDFTSKRISSWDRSGKNIDFIKLGAGERRELANIAGPGAIKHLYSASLSLDPFFFRNVVLRIFWDDETNPSVEVPLGDFFGIGHCKPRLFSSLLLSVNNGNPFESHRQYTYGTNCYFPMPFSKSARIELENQSAIPIEAFWFHIDYQCFDRLEDNVYRFHALWNRETTKVAAEIQENKNVTLWDGANLTGKDNYTILDTQGNGQLVGLLLNVDNIAGNWWGEGDDMVFIDDDTWPPSLHGTGTEEIFGGGACPGEEYSTPYSGFHLISNENWYRQNSMYRFFVADPIRFRKSIRYTIEHGHSNNFENDYSSVAYWYQMEPHKEFHLSPPAERQPLLPSAGENETIKKQTETVGKIYETIDSVLGGLRWGKTEELFTRCAAAENAYHEGKYEIALNEWKQIEGLVNGISR